MIDDLRQPAVAGPLVKVNEVRGDADGPFLIQRQCDELGPVLTIRCSDINSAAATSTPVTIDDQVQAARIAIDLGLVQRRPAGAGEIYWFGQFDTQALWGLAKTRGKAHLVHRRTGQFRMRKVIDTWRITYGTD